MSEKDRRFWDKAARKYAASAIADEEAFARTLTRVRELTPPGARVLELGCGTGTAALRLADAAESYLGTDISGEMIAIAKEKLAAAEDRDLALRLSFRAATAETLAEEPDCYDIILGFNYIHLAGDLPGALAHIRALLAPGGLFISKTPCIGEVNPLFRPLIHLAIPVMQLFGKAPSVTSLTAASLEDAIRAAGFSIEETAYHSAKKNDWRPFIVARAPQ
jgi:SAM-dependent methyltransferase